VHQHIYMSEGVGSTNCTQYLQRLCASLSDVLRPEEQGEIVVEGIDAEIPTDRIVPVGLIVNELVTNAAKHGSGGIVVSFDRATNEGYALSVSDDGAGLPEGFDPAAGGGLGMKVVSALVRQLNGKLLFGPAGGSRGTRFTVLFPSADAGSRH
jgi:two-component sensor histidine kinase